MPRVTRRSFLVGMLATTVVVACAPSTPAAPTVAPAAPATTAPTAASPTVAAAAAATTPKPAAGAATPIPVLTNGPNEILNVSFDPTREFYQAIDAAFIKDWQAKNGQTVSVKQSHGGSGSQAQAVINGLAADVVTLAVAIDINAIQKVGLIASGWEAKEPNKSLPYYSTILLVVRKGNPKGIKDFGDLAKPGIGVITPNPKTSGGARWNYLSAWGWALKQAGGTDATAKDLVTNIYRNTLVLDSGARASTTTFTERGIGDVLIAWECDALLATKKLGPDKYDLVIPSTTIRADPPVAVVDKTVDKRGTRALAEGYLKFLYTDPAQDIAGQNYFRPQTQAIADKYASQFAKIPFFTIDDPFGGWDKANDTHFADGAIFDQIYQPKA